MRYTNMKRSEATEQMAAINWCNTWSIKHPELRLMFHITNGGKRNKLEADNLKRKGVKAGVLDLFLPVPRSCYNGLFIELKYGNNKTTDNKRNG